MEGGPLSACGARRSTAHTRLNQMLNGWRAAPFRNVALARAPRTCVLRVCSSVKDDHGSRSSQKWRFGTMSEC
eukprot:4593224-Pyramimonas_sp.AAC.1